MGPCNQQVKYEKCHSALKQQQKCDNAVRNQCESVCTDVEVFLLFFFMNLKLPLQGSHHCCKTRTTNKNVDYHLQLHRVLNRFKIITVFMVSHGSLCE